MICFFHGSDQLISRQQLFDLTNQAKEEEKEIIKLNGLRVNLTEVLQALQSSSLFDQQRLIIIENLFSRPKSKEKEKIIKFLKKEKITADLVFWEKKEISGRTLRWLPKNWQIKKFKTAAIIFKFLDSFKPSNNQETINLLHQCLKQQSPEMVFYMLARQIKNLILAKDLGKKGLVGAPWQKGKLVKQANYFTLNQLISLYKQLLKMDTYLKTGKSLMPLEWQLDILMANI